MQTGEAYGIERKNIVIDPLCMTISSDDHSAVITLETLRQVKQQLGVKTILGVSNISFGLPRRDLINSNFYAMALAAGLDCGIINPNAEAMMAAYYSYKALAGKDENCGEFIGVYANTIAPASGTVSASGQTERFISGNGQPVATLEGAIEKGLKEQARIFAARLVEEIDPLVVINEKLVPALDRVGKGFEQGTVFLPQLLMSAEAAKAAFASVKAVMERSGKKEKKGKIIVATVKGDIHDIGKNIVKVLLENYGFDVLDLGKDVTAQAIVEAAMKEDVKLVGLSALMTTTVSSMEEAIRLLHREKSDCKVMIGGAVLTEQYAAQIQADFYAKDAMASVYFAQNILG